MNFVDSTKLVSLFDFERSPNWSQKISADIKIGVATSALQVDGGDNHTNSNWHLFEKGCKADGSPNIERGETSGIALDFWNHPEVLIEKLKELGLKNYRFSVEWSSICPRRGEYSEEALKKYEDLCSMLLREGIEPLITLHHFSDPIWFEQMGGFEHDQNIADFVDFSKVVYQRLSPYVKNWVTFNEPSIYAFQGWIRGVFPPAKKDAALCGIVLRNLMKAHCDVYDALKAMDGYKDSKIGIAHQALRFRPYSFLESVPCELLTRVTHNAVMDFFKTGNFCFELPDYLNYVGGILQIPGSAHVTYSRPDIHEKFDFFAVQYYTDPLISAIWKSTYDKEGGGKMTNMPFRFYPQGLATLLEECRELKKPIWITETGAAAPEPDQKEFIKKALKVASYARETGVPVERVYLWTLADNFEWDMGWMEKPEGFGLYDFNPNTHEYRLRPSGKFIQKLLRKTSKNEIV
ncbi:family 1 glycosylhydrolase [Estrella lausannensis]|uniref:Glycosyl hydrolase n=1 Tax=Estrella lausannensis TaxID=483423 RepID=A0A0H5E7K9_9BACT|nr:family 1 glycosylhydrolase [Estrella lausannensis]CRX39310.1 Glycosyl hydrolase [Estrella lausannensis]